jgi:hypothetical protein
MESLYSKLDREWERIAQVPSAAASSPTSAASSASTGSTSLPTCPPLAVQDR